MWEFLPEKRLECQAKAAGHSNYIGFGKEGEMIVEGYEYPCYSSITYRTDPIERLFIFFGKKLVKKKKGAKKWANWLVNESFFAPAFITKDAKEGFEMGFEIDTSCDRILMQGGMITLRVEFENPNGSWKQFLDMGFSELESFALARKYVVRNGNLFVNNFNSNHYMISLDQPLSSFEGKHALLCGECLKDGFSDEYWQTTANISRGNVVGYAMDVEDLECVVHKDAFGYEDKEVVFSLESTVKLLNMMKKED